MSRKQQVAPRRMEQSIFRSIVEMAYEMDAVEQEEKRCKEFTAMLRSHIKENLVEMRRLYRNHLWNEESKEKELHREVKNSVYGFNMNKQVPLPFPHQRFTDNYYDPHFRRIFGPYTREAQSVCVWAKGCWHGDFIVYVSAEYYGMSASCYRVTKDSKLFLKYMDPIITTWGKKLYASIKEDAEIDEMRKEAEAEEDD